MRVFWVPPWICPSPCSLLLAASCVLALAGLLHFPASRSPLFRCSIVRTAFVSPMRRVGLHAISLQRWHKIVQQF